MINFFLFLINAGLFSAVNFLVYKGNYGPRPFFFWIVSILVLILSFRRLWPKHWTKNFQLDWALVLVILIIYGIRFTLLYDPQSVFFHGDEAMGSRNAQQAFEQGLTEGKWDLLGAKDGTLNRFPALWYYLQGGIIHFLGPSVASIKFFAFLTDIGICILVYYLACLWFNKGTALAASLIYSTLPLTIHFGTSGYQNIQSTFFLLLTMAFLVKGEKRASQKGEFWFLLAGIACGLGMYFYFASFLNPVIGLIFLFFWLMGKWRFWLKATLLFLVGFIITTGPFITFSIFDYNFITGREVVYNFWPKEPSPVKMLLSQIRKFVLGFYSTSFNGAGQHYIDLPAIPNILALSLFLLGLIMALLNLRKRNRGFLEVITVFLITSLLCGVATEAPPGAHRLIHLFPMIALIITIGIWQIKQILSSLTRNSFLAKTVFWLLVIICAGNNLFSFYKKNLPRYRRQMSNNEYSFSRFYLESGFSETVFINIPLHKRDQIYYHSKGLISPIPLDHGNFSNQIKNWFSKERKSFIFLTNEQGLKFLNQIPNLIKYKIDWQNIEKFTLWRVFSS